MAVMRSAAILGMVAVLWGLGALPAAHADSDLAEHLVAKTGVARGICVILDCGDGELAVEIAQTGRFLVHALDGREESVAAAREKAGAAGLDIQRLIVEKSNLSPLPHVDGLVDVVIAADLAEVTLAEVPLGEVLRVLRPRGKAILGCQGRDAALSVKQLRGWLKDAEIGDADVEKDDFGVWAVVTKPPLEGVDDWSHWEHTPDNNPVSTDAVIKAPYMTRWLGTPYYIAMPATTTAAGGRIFTAMGHIAHHRREEPWLNTLLARNGYNGVELWRRKLPDGYLAHRSAYVATDETFYMIAPEGDACLLLDPETGAEKDRIRFPSVPGEWKWMALHDGTLFVLLGGRKDPAETTIIRSKYTHWSWGELSTGYYLTRVPWGFGTTIVAYDMSRRRVDWSHEEEAPIDSRAMVLGGGSVFFYCPDARVACLDQHSGKARWTNEDPKVRNLVGEAGRGLGSTPGFRSSCFCLYTPQAVCYEAQTRMNIVALSTEDGHLLWHRRKTTNNPNMLYADGHVVVGIGPEGSTLVLDPLTGKTIEDLGFAKRSCARLTATPDSFFCRGKREGLTRYDRLNKRVLFNEALRPACNDGAIGANGLLYVGPWLCDCNLQLMGTCALCSAGDFRFDLDAHGPDRLERPADNPGRVVPLDVSPEDWATYRGGTAHGGSSGVDVAPQIGAIWHYEPDRTYLPTAPTAAGNLVFLCGNDGKVRAIDAVSGMLAWRFVTAGPILQPPTIWDGRAYVGSGDGYVYVLEAATGRLVWRFRAAPVERRIMVYGALCSTWPVNSGVLVQDGVAYVAAGIADYDGTYVYALDAVTGQVLWQNDSSGHLDQAPRKGVSAQGNLTIAEGRLWMPGGNVVSPAAFDLETGQYCGVTPRSEGDPRANRGEEIGVFRGEYVVFGGRLRYSATESIVNPGYFLGFEAPRRERAPRPMFLCGGKAIPAWDGEGVVFVEGRNTVPKYCAAKAVADFLRGKHGKRPPKPMWEATKLEGRDVIALALTPKAVLVVSEVAVERSIRSRWIVSRLDRKSGALTWEQDLPGAALHGGLLVDREGRVIVALRDGSVVCLGGAKALEARIERLVDRVKAGKQAVKVLKDMLPATHGAEARNLIIARLGELGLDVTRGPKQRGCITRWWLLGPVPWNDDNPVDKAFVGEPDVDVTEPIKIGVARRAWREYVTVRTDGMVDLAQIYGPLEGVAVYVYAEVELSEAQDLLLMIGSNDGFKCWFNGKEAGRFDGGRSYAPDQDTLKVTGVEGANRILLKVTQMGANWACSARLTHPDETPIDLTGDAAN